MLVRERLAGLLREKDVTQSQFARKLREHRNWVNYRVTGQTDIKADELPRIAQALGVSPCDFFEPADSHPVPAGLPYELVAMRAGLRARGWSAEGPTDPAAVADLATEVLLAVERYLRRLWDAREGGDAQTGP